MKIARFLISRPEDLCELFQLSRLRCGKLAILAERDPSGGQKNETLKQSSSLVSSADFYALTFSKKHPLEGCMRFEALYLLYLVAYSVGLRMA